MTDHTDNSARAVAQTSAPTPALIPLPARVRPSDGVFVLGPETRIVLDGGDGDETRAVADYLAGLLRRVSGLPLPVMVGGDGAGAITLRLDPSIRAPEGYRLSVSPAAVEIAASAAQGLFYGAQTLRQLAPVEIESAGPVAGVAWQLPAVEIEDAPRFGYRGMHLDVGRHCFPVAFIKKYIDLLAAYKLNTFHWHLTDDQGWRIEIKKYPRLTSVGAWRRETQTGFGLEGAGQFDGQPYGGFYTQDDVREVVAYAASRFVTVMPEIDLPGHMLAALAAYPELGGGQDTFEVGTGWGVFDGVLDPSEATFEFLEGVLAEVLALFPSRLIHLGGDEVPTKRWQASPVAQALMAREGMARVEEVHGYFMRRMSAFLASHGRKLAGWDEVLEGGRVPDATITSWRGLEGGIQAARLGQDVIMAPHQFTYFDHYQGLPDEGEQVALLPALPLEMVYGFEPVPAELSEAESRRILGAQGNVWTEWMRTPERVEQMALPRMLALAEGIWSPKAARDWDSFARRLPAHFERLALWPAEYGRHFYRARQLNTLDAEGRYFVRLYGNSDDAVHYTLDGCQPDAASPRYEAPLELTGPATLSAVLVRDGQPLWRPAVWRYHVGLATGRSVRFNNVAPGDEYPAGLEQALTTGLRGIFSRVGWGSKDLDATVDLGAPHTVRRVEIGFGADSWGWVRFPRQVEVLTSEDGLSFTPAAATSLAANGAPGQLTTEVALDFEPVTARYVRVKAANHGPLPAGHPGAGQQAGLWVDGIIVA